jgi:hypothetical protein
MAIEGNSFKDRTAPKADRVLKPVADGKIDEKRKSSLLERWFKDDSSTIRDFLIESIVIPSLLDGISGIGEIIIDSFTDGISTIFENKGFGSTSRKSRSGHTDYRGASTNRRRRRDRDRDDEDDYDDEERSYDNVRVKTEREARNVINELKDLIADRDYGYATVANLYELTDNIVVHTDHRYGWTKLDHDTRDYYVRTGHREKPWLLRLPRPKDLSDFK